jgi:hypothetical protein
MEDSGILQPGRPAVALPACRKLPGEGHRVDLVKFTTVGAPAAHFNFGGRLLQASFDNNQLIT